jgi:hypothetical protein
MAFLVPGKTTERSAAVNQQSSAIHPARNPSNTQPTREATAARKSCLIFTRRIPVKTRTAIVAKEDERRKEDVPFRAAAGCRPSAMPLANAAAIATAGSLMALFAT